jgi:hypothetical protein
MRQDLSYHHWVLDAGDDPHSAAAGLAGLNIYPEYALKTLRPSHGRPEDSRLSSSTSSDA